MATTRSFQDMLNEYLTYDLLREEMVKRDFLLSKMTKKNDWKGGTLVVPFKGSYASSISFGSLTAENDISEDAYVRGQITTQPEVWGSMKFNHRDLMEHNGKVNEQSFLKLLPGAIEDFMDNMKAAVSQNLLSGSHVVTLTSDGTAAGTCTVDRVERLTLMMKGQLDDGNSPAINVYVRGIDTNTNTVLLYGDRTTSLTDIAITPLNITAYTTAQSAKIYFDNAQTNSFTSLKSSLLSAANGGSATLYTKTKTEYPFLQSINISGATVTSTNIISKLFDAQNTIRQKGKGNPTDAIVSYRNLGWIMAAVEASKGAYKVSSMDTKANLYNWTTVTIQGVKGTMTVNGVYEMDNDFIPFMDWRALAFHSNNFFQKRTAPDGKQYYEVRSTSGYYYITDICLAGDMVLSRPSYCGIMHSIP